MKYLQRNQAGDVIAFYQSEQKGVAEEAAPDDHPEILAFLLGARKQGALAGVSEAAEEIRLRFITPGSGKALAYMEKAAQARACKDDAARSAVKYPLIYAEIGITAGTAVEVATEVAARHAQFQAIEAQIARAELAARKAIRDAGSEAELTAALRAIAWPNL